MKLYCFFICIFFLISFGIQAQQDRLAKAVSEYYEQFLMLSEQTSREHVLQEACENFFDKIKNLEFFLQKHGIQNLQNQEIKNIRMSYKNKPYSCFFYPAWLYEKRQSLVESLDKKKRESLISEILKKEEELSPEIQQKMQLQTKQKKAQKEMEEQQREQIRIQREIEEGKRKLEKNKEEEESMESEIEEKKSRISFFQNKHEEALLSISRLQRLLATETNPFKKQKWERQLKSAEFEKEDYINKVYSLQRELKDMEKKFKENQKEIEYISSQMYEWERKEADLKKQVLKLQEELKEIQNSLATIEIKLQPLMLLLSEKQQKEALLKRASEWWRRANNKPRRNFLQAFYVLQNFPEEYYQIKIKKSYALEGMVEVYFW